MNKWCAWYKALSIATSKVFYYQLFILKSTSDIQGNQCSPSRHWCPLQNAHQMAQSTILTIIKYAATLSLLYLVISCDKIWAQRQLKPNLINRYNFTFPFPFCDHIKCDKCTVSQTLRYIKARSNNNTRTCAEQGHPSAAHSGCSFRGYSPIHRQGANGEIYATKGN